MKFSIIVPAYNVADYIEDCIQSILKQNFSNYEIIIVNDGSTDQTGEICNRLSRKYKSISTVHKENGGLSSARNAGLKIACGDYIIYLDSDDFWINHHFLFDINKILEENPVDLVFFPHLNYFSGMNIQPQINPHYLKFKNIKNLSFSQLIDNKILKSSAWDKVVNGNICRQVLFRENTLSEDIEWTIKLLELSKSFSIYEIDTYAYRQNRKGSITYNVSRKNLEDILSLLERESNNMNIHSEKILSFHYLEILPYIYPFHKDALFTKKIKKLSFLAYKARHIDLKKSLIFYTISIFGYKNGGFLLYKLTSYYKLIKNNLY